MNVSTIILYEDAIKLLTLFFTILSFSLIILGIINKKHVSIIRVVFFAMSCTLFIYLQWMDGILGKQRDQVLS